MILGSRAAVEWNVACKWKLLVYRDIVALKSIEDGVYGDLMLIVRPEAIFYPLKGDYM